MEKKQTSKKSVKKTLKKSLNKTSSTVKKRKVSHKKKKDA